MEHRSFPFAPRKDLVVEIGRLFDNKSIYSIAVVIVLVICGDIVYVTGEAMYGIPLWLVGIVGTIVAAHLTYHVRPGAWIWEVKHDGTVTRATSGRYWGFWWRRLIEFGPRTERVAETLATDMDPFSCLWDTTFLKPRRYRVLVKLAHQHLHRESPIVEPNVDIARVFVAWETELLAARAQTEHHPDALAKFLALSANRSYPFRIEFEEIKR